jgi:glycine oxidase
MPPPHLRPDICIAGGGIIGLSLALELERRGASVVVLEARSPLRQASSAAAGMLAADDPDNPPELSSLAHLSLALYPRFLARIEELAAVSVPFQTSLTVQATPADLAKDDRPSGPLCQSSSSQLPSSFSQPQASFSQPIDEQIHSIASQKFSAPQIERTLSSHLLTTHRLHLLNEHSIDPRQLASALLAAVQAAGIQVHAETPVLSITARSSSTLIRTTGAAIEAGVFVDCTGAWASHAASTTALPTIPVVPIPDIAIPVVPIKGQMLALAIPDDLPLDFTLRTTGLYIVPRLYGPNAGRAVVGATIEDAGFDTTVYATDIAALHAQAISLIPALAHAPILDSWAGLRPASPDRLPLLGVHPTQDRCFIATAHYRNGILLAPATARVMADLILTGTPSIDLSTFAPDRFRRR